MQLAGYARNAKETQSVLSNILSQSYYGDVTIFPELELWDYKKYAKTLVDAAEIHAVQSAVEPHARLGGARAGAGPASHVAEACHDQQPLQD